MNQSRRAFLRAAGAVGASGAGFALNLAAIGAAAAQSSAATDYRALVCLFLYGGNDQGNTVLATDPQSWSAYLAARNLPPDPIALDLSSAGTARSVIDIAPATAQPGRSFALHPNLAPLKALFDARRAAIVANVGPLVVPTTRAQWDAKAVPLPAKLFSHNDQQSTWMSYSPEGSQAGWGGRIGDLLMSANGAPVFTAVSAAGNAVFLAGQQAVQYQVSTGGAVPINGLSGAPFGSAATAAALRALTTTDRANLFEKELVRVQNRSIDAQGTLNANILPVSALASVAVPTLPDSATADPLALQLQVVARIIGGRSGLGARRQVFFVGLSSFDTHDAQNAVQFSLLSRMARAVAYFDQLLQLPAINAANQVTLFTASDFGRTLLSNGDGTDHGWGSHHFVVGGAVRGGDLYGRFPVVGQNTPDDVGSGRLLPTIAVDQYAATLGRWMGVSATDLAAIMPNLGNFTVRDLGFLA